MKILGNILAGAAGLAVIAIPTAATAQYQNYPTNNNGAGVIGSIINNVLGNGQYPYGNYGYNQQNNRGSQIAVDQCARAAEARLNNSSMNTQYNQWNPNRNPYSNWAVQGQGRVLGIDNVRYTKNGRLRVTGVATSGRQYQNGYGYGGYQYNRNYGTPDLKFTCRADSRGRVYDVDFTRMSYYGGR